MAGGDKVDGINEGDADYLRSRAKKYRRVADDVGDKSVSDDLRRLADAYESDADSLGGSNGDEPKTT